VFVTTYRLAGAGRPHTYEKHAVVHAYQPGKPFAVRTQVAGLTETDPANGGATDWLAVTPAARSTSLATMFSAQLTNLINDLEPILKARHSHARNSFGVRVSSGTLKSRAARPLRLGWKAAASQRRNRRLERSRIVAIL
jgi:hypothetical protein